MKSIELTRGKAAIIDDEDYERVMAVGKWQAVKPNDRAGWYATHATHIGMGKERKVKNIPLANVIMGYHEFIVDHINGNTLDNRKCNLRYCAQRENTYNVQLRKTSKSGFKGVHLSNRRRSFIAKIVKDGKEYYLGSFNEAKEAAKVYNQKAIELFGEYAWLNKID